MEPKHSNVFGLFGGPPPVSGFAVKNVDEAQQFYGEVLGLNVDQADGLLRIRTRADGEILVYPKDDHVPATYTILNFPVPDIDAAVAELNRRGVSMQIYPGFDQDAKGINRRGPAIAWFTDPSGNILAVLQ